MEAFDASRATLRLIGGMDQAAFDDEIRERRAMRFAAAFGGGHAAELFGLARLEALLRSEAMPLAQVDLYQDGHLIRLADVQRKSGRSGSGLIAERLAQGATVRVRDVDAFDQRLGALAACVRRRFAAPAQINMYLTPPGQDGFPPHFDITDGFIVQCLGAKQWRVFRDYAQRVELPPMATNWEPERFRPLGEPETIELSAGDVLYVPRGVMHEARCTERASLHLTVSIEPITYADLVRRALEQATLADLAWRRRVPWSADGGTDEARRIAAAVRERLLALADALDVPALLAAERTALFGGAAAAAADAALAERLDHLFPRHTDDAG
ncbi:MAG: hypothetical protein IT532_11555 [Burkholderiales bacterium]|nr:hypothetical protein [Burkholderiales bacterium]